MVMNGLGLVGGGELRELVVINPQAAPTTTNSQRSSLLATSTLLITTNLRESASPDCCIGADPRPISELTWVRQA